MNKIKQMFFIFISALILNGVSATAQTVISPCLIPKLDGEKVPFPLKSANTKFELAENETYLLNGFLLTSNGSTYFKIDFDSQPWLATQQRMQNPYFAVNSDLTMVKQFGGSLVEVAVVVRKPGAVPSVDMITAPKSITSIISIDQNH